MSKVSNEREDGLGFGVLGSGKTGPFGPGWELRAVKTRLAIAIRGGQAYVVGRTGVHNGNSGLELVGQHICR
jgi:hypothetical protein